MPLMGKLPHKLQIMILSAAVFKDKCTNAFFPGYYVETKTWSLFDLLAS